MTKYPNLLRCMDYPRDIKIGYKVRNKNTDQLLTITDIEIYDLVDGGKKYVICSETEDQTVSMRMHRYETDFVEVYVEDIF